MSDVSQLRNIEDVKVPEFGDVKPEELIATLQEENTMLRVLARKQQIYIQAQGQRITELKDKAGKVESDS
jgi:hypothetical protein